MTTIDIILHVVVVVILYINLYIIVLESCIENNVDMLTYYESSSLWIINECIWSVWWPSGLNALVREKHLTSTLQPCTTCRQILRNKRRAPTPLKSVGVWHCTTMRDQVMVAVARTWSTLSACFGTVFGLAEECMPSDFTLSYNFSQLKSTMPQQVSNFSTLPGKALPKQGFPRQHSFPAGYRGLRRDWHVEWLGYHICTTARRLQMLPVWRFTASSGCLC